MAVACFLYCFKNVYCMTGAELRRRRPSGAQAYLELGDTLHLAQISSEGIEVGTKFVRDSIQKIQDDLSWQ